MNRFLLFYLFFFFNFNRTNCCVTLSNIECKLNTGINNYLFILNALQVFDKMKRKKKSNSFFLYFKLVNCNTFIKIRGVYWDWNKQDEPINPNCNKYKQILISIKETKNVNRLNVHNRIVKQDKNNDNDRKGKKTNFHSHCFFFICNQKKKK